MGAAVDGPDPPHKKGYRWDIQGMRAVAVLLVLLAHAQVPGFAGGFIGVDVFFVISGFLITGILLADATKHRRVGFAHFYARRARRILPAATTVIVATAIASTLILNYYQAKSALVDSVWAGFFAANIHFASQGTNYFTAALATVSPLQHYWSLSVEEQFYVVWPALLAVAGFGVTALRRRARSGTEPAPPSTARIAVVLVALGAVSLYFSINQTASNPQSAYFSTIDRAWELVVGALLAVLLPQVGRLPDRVRAALSWIGLAGIVVAAMTFTSATAVPGWITLLPVLCAAAVITGGVGAPRGSTAGLLSMRPFRFFGAISYSLYLWHFPILILGAAYFPFTLNLAQRLLLLVVATVVATFSYLFIERPFQHARRLTRRTYSGLVLWPVAISMIVVVAITAQPDTSFASRIGPAVRGLSPSVAVADAVRAAKANDAIPKRTDPSVLDATSNREYLGLRCSAWKQLRSQICEKGDPRGTKTIAVFGNSHSNMWIPSVAILAKQARWKFFPVVKEACGYDDYAALRNVDKNSQCVLWYHWAFGVLKRMHPNVLVVGVYGFREWAQGLSIILPELKPLTDRLVLIGDAPGIRKIPGYCLSQPGATQGTCLWPESTLRIQDLGTARRLAKKDNIGFVDPESWFCYKRLCPSVIDSVIPYYDSGHLTIAYAQYLAPALGAFLDLTGRVHR
jgi:peptidoglycan/LPS O-acetylase OafA/YrhL